ncbi:tyrosine-type recombinase/integrase [Mesorhizobium australicum]|uniref:tyrosine-type recombinase/integrase n=1 Tax=Mesorhizobium australicum TaxID=536018 RepID=UPI00333A9B9A
MTAKAKITTDKALSALTGPGKIYSDSIKDTGLYLLVTKSGTRRWVFIYSRHGKRRELALGVVDGPKGISLKDARNQARAYQATLALGGDPWNDARREREQQTKAQTFGEFADTFIAEQAKGFRNAKHIAQWKMTMKVYAKRLQRLPLDKIETADVLAVLQPVWTTKPETAKRTQGRIERILDAARAQGLRDGENPARWRGHLDKLLSRQSKLSRGHHAALHYGDVPAFLAKLRQSDAVSALALEFLILTAARTGEVIAARWNEIDAASAVWTVPAVRMKAGREHRVPLSTRALEILNAVVPARTAPSGFIFPGAKEDKGLSQMALAMMLRQRGQNTVTVHGFRSGFRDWAAEETDSPREVAEAALAHAVGDATERAYRRGDALAKRRVLMDAWSAFCG